MCLTLQMMTLEKYLTKKIEIFWGVTPILAPRSAASPKMTTIALPMSPLLLLQNPFLLEKCGCLQKTRGQSFKIWPRCKGFKFDKTHSQNFPFYWSIITFYWASKVDIWSKTKQIRSKPSTKYDLGIISATDCYLLSF